MISVSAIFVNHNLLRKQKNGDSFESPFFSLLSFAEFYNRIDDVDEAESEKPYKHD